MNIFHTVFAARLILILGILNLVTGSLLLFTCRIVPALRVAKNLMQNSFYKNIYRFHAYLWWIFWISVIVHAVFAISAMGWPF
jgi:cytochrome b561